MEFKRSVLLSANLLLGFAGTLIAPMSVLADSASGPAGNDPNAPETTPPTNPKIIWNGGGSAGSVSTVSSSGGVTTETKSLVGVSWHTDPDKAVLSLLSVPNFDFGAWRYTAGPNGAGSYNNNWYPVVTDSRMTPIRNSSPIDSEEYQIIPSQPSIIRAPYSSGEIAGYATFATLYDNATLLNFNGTGFRTDVDIDGSLAGESARASAVAAGLNDSQVAAAKNSAAAAKASELAKDYRVLAVKDNRACASGWRVQLAVGSFDRDGSGDGTVTGTSPAVSNKHLKGAAIYINADSLSFGKMADNYSLGFDPPFYREAVIYSADTRGSYAADGSYTYNYGAPVTIWSADQSSDPDEGVGGWILDFASKRSAGFTSPTEGLGTYTASLKWILTSGPS